MEIKMKDLKEIRLTEDNGYVTMENNEPVEILGGIEMTTENKCTTEDLIKRVEGAIRWRSSLRGMKKALKDVNGYIIHGSVQIRDCPSGTPEKDRDMYTFFAAVKYRKKEII